MKLSRRRWAGNEGIIAYARIEITGLEEYGGATRDPNGGFIYCLLGETAGKFQFLEGRDDAERF